LFKEEKYWGGGGDYKGTTISNSIGTLLKNTGVKGEKVLDASVEVKLSLEYLEPKERKCEVIFLDFGKGCTKRRRTSRGNRAKQRDPMPQGYSWNHQ